MDGNPACAGGNSDPVMYGFAGRSFNFMGEVGKIYSIISTQTLQVRAQVALILNSGRLHCGQSCVHLNLSTQPWPRAESEMQT